METTVALRPPSDTALAPYGVECLSDPGLQQALVQVLGSPTAANVFLVSVLNQVRNMAALPQCTLDSLRCNLVRVAQLHLDPALPNEVYFIPRRQQQADGKTAMELTTQFGYGGLRKLILRAPDVVDCFTKEVCANDEFVPPASPIDLPVHRHPGAFAPRGRVIGYYAAAQLRNGHWRTVLMSVADVEAHVKRYVREAGGPWGRGGKRPDEDGLTNFDKMALKTCLRMLCNARDLTLTSEISQALALEEGPEVPAPQRAIAREVPDLGQLTEDLYGPPPATPWEEDPPAHRAPPVASQSSMDPAFFVHQMEALWRQIGMDEAVMKDRWHRMERRCQQVPIPEKWYAPLLEEQRQWVAKERAKRQAAQDMQTDPEPEEGAHGDDDVPMP